MERYIRMLVTCCALIVATGGFTVAKEVEMAPNAMAIGSPAFAEGARVPMEHTCEGANVSPALTVAGVPDSAVSLALIMDDPDAPSGTWVHWVVWNIPAGVAGLSRGVAPDAELPDGTRQGLNSAGKRGYFGPCPPRKHGRHRYYFKLYALDTPLELPTDATKADLVAAMEGHVIAEAQLMGIYSRE